MEWISVQDLPPHDKVESHSLKLIHEVAGFYTGRVDIDYSPWSFLQEDEEVKIWINHSWDDSNQKAIFRVEKSDDVLKYICTIFTFTGKKQMSQEDDYTTLIHFSGSSEQKVSIGRLEDIREVLNFSIRLRSAAVGVIGKGDFDFYALILGDESSQWAQSEVKELKKSKTIKTPPFEVLEKKCGFLENSSKS